MLQAPNTDLFNPLVPKAHRTECQNLPFPLQINPVKVNLKLIFGFFHPQHKWVKDWDNQTRSKEPAIGTYLKPVLKTS